MKSYNIPESLEDLFKQGENMYQIIDYEINEMDNIESLNFFIEILSIPSDNIINNYDTEIILFHQDYDFMLSVNSYGLGDFYSHGFDVSLYQSD